MALKNKDSDTDESSDDEDSKMKSYITRQFKKFMKNANAKASTRIVDSQVLLNLRAKTKGRRMLGMAISTLFPHDQSGLDVKVSVT